MKRMNVWMVAGLAAVALTGGMTRAAEITRPMLVDSTLHSVMTGEFDFEVQFVQIRAEDAKGFGISHEPQPQGDFAVGIVRGNLTGELNKLFQQNKAKLINFPKTELEVEAYKQLEQNPGKGVEIPGNVISYNPIRMTVPNGYRAEGEVRMSQPATLGFQEKSGRFRPLFEAKSSKEGAVLAGTGFRFTVTPTLQAATTPAEAGDEAIQLTMSLSRTLQFTNGESVELFPLRRGNDVQFTINVRDGDTFALSGLSTRLAAPFNRASQNREPSDMLVFVTPRIIRRMVAKPVSNPVTR